jgi:1,3,6,8-tetrahydroxynaphthalene synthase
MSIVCEPAVAFPDRAMLQKDWVEKKLARMLPPAQLERVRKMASKSKVEKRYFADDPLAEGHGEQTFEARNQKYIKAATELSLRAATQALENARLSPRDIDAVVAVTVTGVMIPGLDVYLCNALNLREDVVRMPAMQVGCAGGAWAMAIADRLCKSGCRNVLIACAEISSVNWHDSVTSADQLVSGLVFGDGAAAAIVRDNAGSGLSITGTTMGLVPNSSGSLGMSVVNDGLEVVLKKDVPNLLGDAADHFHAIAARQGLEVRDFKHYVLHPGGQRVLENFEKTFDVPREALQHSYDCMRENGNISSASILDVLRRLFESGTAEAGDTVFFGGFGPGFSAVLGTGVWAAAERVTAERVGMG